MTHFALTKFSKFKACYLRAKVFVLKDILRFYVKMQNSCVASLMDVFKSSKISIAISSPPHLLFPLSRSPSLCIQTTMDFHAVRCVLHLLTISSLLCSLSRAESSGSVFFVDGKSGRYIRSPSPDDVVAQSHSISLLEVGAAVSVLLGFAPPATLSAAGSAKLNEVLVPNPFSRPRAAFMLEVTGAEGLLGDMFSSALRNKIVGSEKAQIHLPGEEVSVIYLDEGLADPTEKEIGDFASWLGGSYVIDSSAVKNGELSIPLPSGASVNFHMSKKADKEFITSLLALFHNSRSAIQMHEALSKNTYRPAELMMGCFAGIKALKEQYGSEGIVQQGLELLIASLSKTLDSLQAAYKGQIVGVILFNEAATSESRRMLDVMLTSRSSARWLAETESSHGTTNATLAEVALVRKTLAWITGIILLISTFLGVYLLLNMPLTRDTLLYSNVKLD